MKRIKGKFPGGTEGGKVHPFRERNRSHGWRQEGKG